MANPLSAVDTPYRVAVNEWALYANCAWTSLGIPAMLGADARIEAVYTDVEGSGTTARFTVIGGALRGYDGIVHFPLPLRHWHDNLIHT